MGNSSNGFGLLCLHDNCSALSKYTPAFRSLLRVATCMLNGRLDGQADQQVLDTTVHLDPPMVQQDTQNSRVIQRESFFLSNQSYRNT